MPRVFWHALVARGKPMIRKAIKRGIDQKIPLALRPGYQPKPGYEYLAGIPSLPTEIVLALAGGGELRPDEEALADAAIAAATCELRKRHLLAGHQARFPIDPGPPIERKMVRADLCCEEEDH